MKKIIAIFLIISLLFCTGGCSKEKDSSSQEQSSVSSGDKVVDCYVEYDRENKCHLLLFGLSDSDGTYFSFEGFASVTITDHSGKVLCERNILFSEHFFSEWITPSWDSARLLCGIHIEDYSITGNAANSKTVSLQITLDDGRFFDAGDISVTRLSANTGSNFSPYEEPDDNDSGFVDNSSQHSFPNSSPQTPTEPIPLNQQMKNEADACGAPYKKLGRALVWHDEFSGSKLDSNKWVFSETMWNANHEHVNDSKHVRVENGNLHLQIWKSNKSGKTCSMASGVTTTNTMLFKYGYLEMRAKVPYRKGAWPSFWCTSRTPLQEATHRMEVDILEGWGSTDRFSANLHKWSADGTKHVAIPSGSGWPNLTHKFYDPTNLNNEYHTYGFEWDTKKMNFYVDDYKFATIDISSPGANFGVGYITERDMFHDWLRVIINNECFAPGDPYASSSNVLTNSDTMPIDYYIDYVRLYQNTSKGEIFKTTDEIAAIVASKNQ